MAFEPYVPKGPKTAHRRSPAQATIATLKNRQTTVRFTAAARDHLLVRTEADGSEELKPGFIAVLHDPAAGRVRLQAVAEELPHSYRANGLGFGQTCYVTVLGLTEDLGIEDGKVLLDLSRPGCVEFAIEDVVPAAERARPQGPARATEASMEEIRSILDEGLDSVNGEQVRR